MISFKTIEEALSQKASALFWIKRCGRATGKGDAVSFFNADMEDEHLTFDVSNNKVLVNMGPDGCIKQTTIYRGCYLADSIPGVWYRKDFCQTGKLSFSIRVEDEFFDLSKVDWPLETSLLDNIFPITRLTGPGIRVTLIAFAPISGDGETRLRAAVYGALVSNMSAGRIEGEVFLPNSYEGDIYSGINDTARGGACISLADFPPAQRDVPFEYWPNCPALVPEQLKVPYALEPGESIWVPAVISDFGGNATGEIREHGTLYWLNSTWNYFKSMMGRFSMSRDKFAGEFFQRAVLQCFGSLGMDAGGRLTGSNWGSYPATANIWMKDMYYSIMPMAMLEPALFKEGILWFLDRSIRPRGNRGVGGVRHSLSNSLSPVAMAGLYYRYTGDKEFFLGNAEIKSKLDDILRQVLESREHDDVWLFPSVWLSDGPTYGDFHTGSNLLAWFSFKSFGEILGEIYGDRKAAGGYLLTAARIREAIEERCVIDGPFGKQYIEGINKDGSIPYMIHEGEESETTLLPFYGYLDYDDPIYRNYMKFSVSEYNKVYNLETKGIQWQANKGRYTDATLPGYIAGFACIDSEESMNGADGYMTEIRRLTDVDGSVWWWPYERQDSKYGKVSRGPCGKCGWASGEFISLFVSQFLGLQFDAPARSMKFRPFSPSGSFSWEDFHLGGGKFSAGYEKNESTVVLTFENKSSEGLKLELEVPVNSTGCRVFMLLNGKETDARIDKGMFLGRTTLKTAISLKPCDTLKLTFQLPSVLL